MKDDFATILEAIRYIDQNLKEKLSVDKISEVAGFSKFHFTRVFTKYVGISPYDYYRGRKVTETINYMELNKCKIIDAAYEFGFSSPEVFVRACQSVFDLSPSKIRRQVEKGEFEGVEAIDEDFLVFANTFEVEPEVKFMPELTLSGIVYTSVQKISSLREIDLNKVKAIIKDQNEGYKVSWLEPGPMGYMNFIGQQGDGGYSEEVLVKTIPPMAYLDFELTVSKEDILHLMAYIYEVFLPESDYEQALPYHIEVLNLITGVGHLYIPIIPK